MHTHVSVQEVRRNSIGDDPVEKLFTCVHKIEFNIQLAKSSRAIHGGAYFSAVCGRKLIPINAPEPYKCQECNRLLFFRPHPFLFHLPQSPTVSSAPWVILNGFVPKRPIWISHQCNFAFLLYLLSHGWSVRSQYKQLLMVRLLLSLKEILTMVMFCEN